MLYKIAILGDFNPAYSTHLALNNCLDDIKGSFKEEIQFDWIGTELFNNKAVFANRSYRGLWIAPGSPYKNMQNVLGAITHCRTNNIPVLGNCGGFQHMIIEFAKNICKIEHADHEEVNPGAADLVISKLSCSLIEKEEALSIDDKDSLLYRIIQKENLPGKYFCSYGLNEKYRDVLQSRGLSLTAFSPDGQVRAFEIKEHPFFLGTLFQPALTSTTTEPDPIILEFINQSIYAN